MTVPEAKNQFPWHAIKIVISDHYHMDMGEEEGPTLYVPAYFTDETLKKIMASEGGSELMNIHLQTAEYPKFACLLKVLMIVRYKFLQEQIEQARADLGVHSIKISTHLKQPFAIQALGLKILQQAAAVFHTVPDLANIRIVLAETYALAQDKGFPKLFVPYDLQLAELNEYLESGTVPERYQETANAIEEEGDEFWSKQPAAEDYHDEEDDYDEYGDYIADDDE